jgi:hypothetical protein
MATESLELGTRFRDTGNGPEPAHTNRGRERLPAEGAELKTSKTRAEIVRPC